jgi:hypothetical protein
MLDEPAAKRRAPDELNRFTVQNYLLVAHMAALRLLLQRYGENLPRAEVNAALENMFGDVRRSLESQRGDATPPHNLTMRTGGWPGWTPLQRRLRLLQQDAAQLALSRTAIGEALQERA